MSYKDGLLGLCLGMALMASGCALHLPGTERLAARSGAVDPLQQWTVIDGGKTGNILFGYVVMRLVRPVAVAARGSQIYVIDAGQSELYAIDRERRRIRRVLDLRSITRGEITDIYVAADLSYYLADVTNDRVLHYTSEGRLLSEIHLMTEVHDLILTGKSVEISVDERTGMLYVADGYDDDVTIYNSDGVLLSEIGERGDSAGKFRGLTAFARSDSVMYVGTRFGARRVQKFDHTGAFVSALEADTVTFPAAIAVDEQGRVYVSDNADNTIKVYANDRLVATLGGTGSTPGRFMRITDLWIDQGMLYVADSLNARIQLLPLSAVPGQIQNPSQNPPSNQTTRGQ